MSSPSYARLESDDPAALLVHQMPAFLSSLKTQSNGYDGTYISLVDGDGQTVLGDFVERTHLGGLGWLPAGSRRM